MTSLMCLAVAIYFEARGETYDGRLAVANVILNRVDDSRYPDTICEVVFESRQFSFTHDGKPDRLPPVPTRGSRRAMQTAKAVLAGDTLGITSTHYHTPSVAPAWKSEFDLDGKWGGHIFYTNNTPHR